MAMDKVAEEVACCFAGRSHVKHTGPLFAMKGNSVRGQEISLAHNFRLWAMGVANRAGSQKLHMSVDASWLRPMWIIKAVLTTI